MKNFWETLAKPILALAPMDGITDTVFRQIVCRTGKPGVMFTEFVNVNWICRDLMPFKLAFTESERPIAVQIWGTEPEKFFRAARKLTDFDGIDINFGCPQRKIVKAGGGAAFINQMPDTRCQIVEIIKAVKEGSGGLPISVKTRIGFDKVITEDWIGFLLEQKLAAITVHGRRAIDRESVPADWEEIGKAVDLRIQSKSRTLIIGNGDIRSLDEAKEKAERYGVDGVMIGRGVWNNPWLFSGQIPAQKEKREMYLLQMELFAQTYGHDNFSELKKFAKAYISDFSGAAEARKKIMESRNWEEMKRSV